MLLSLSRTEDGTSKYVLAVPAHKSGSRVVRSNNENQAFNNYLRDFLKHRLGLCTFELQLYSTVDYAHGVNYMLRCLHESAHLSRLYTYQAKNNLVRLYDQDRLYYLDTRSPLSSL